MRALIFYFFAVFFFLFCSDKKPQQKEDVKKYGAILIQPFSDISPILTNYVFAELRKIHPHIELLRPIALPSNAYYSTRNRYKADSVIRFLSKRTIDGCITIGLTTKDISTSQGKIGDWGVMGLGETPGKACVASSFRLLKTDINAQLFKTAVHELGHTEGLPHCPVKTCFMRDANGKNVTDEENGFCQSCRSSLVNKGWKLS